MRIGLVSFFSFQLLGLIDQGLGQDISIQTVQNHLDRGDLLTFLEETFGKQIDLSLYHMEGGQGAKSLLALLQSLGDIRPGKLNVENNGLCFLLGITVEALQHPEAYGIQPSDAGITIRRTR